MTTLSTDAIAHVCRADPALGVAYARLLMLNAQINCITCEQVHLLATLRADLAECEAAPVPSTLVGRDRVALLRDTVADLEAALSDVAS